jgi:ArsR family transcriptional regulator, arsenate/arsenite/antimonite-responsive transcriptional repressor / arsenate reductase (thioredoxin)
VVEGEDLTAVNDSANIDSMMTETVSLELRAVRHAALGEPHRLAIVDALYVSDRSPSELRALTGLASNLLAFHLDVLEDAGLIARRRSEGDGRRRYVTLQTDALRGLSPASSPPSGPVVFVCTRNAARSQLAAALWRRRTGGEAASAGTEPADRADPLAVAVAAEHGLDPAGWCPAGYDEVALVPALVVSVCDRAREAGLPWSAPALHWSVPDPAGGRRAAYETAYRDLDTRVARLAGADPRW